jgi:hypothetical protein
VTADVAVTPDVVTAPAEPAMVTVDVYEVVASVAYRLSEVARDLPDHSRVGDGRRARPHSPIADLVQACEAAQALIGRLLKRAMAAEQLAAVDRLEREADRLTERFSRRCSRARSTIWRSSSARSCLRHLSGASTESTRSATSSRRSWSERHDDDGQTRSVPPWGHVPRP